MPEPYWTDGQITLYLGDCAEVLAGMDAGSVDAICTDPPYGLEFMGREWDSFKPSGARLRTRADQRTNPAEGKSVTTTPESYSAGQPFQDWCEAWARECLRVLKPGGHMLAFGGTRTWHRLACGIEDAGFEIRDSTADLTGYDAPGLMWVYGSGFPKSLDVSRAIDKAGGASPEVQSRTLRDARERAGLSRDQVAAAVGCTVSSVRDWEEGRRRAIGREVEHLVPSPEYRLRLADLLGYTADERQIVGVGGGSRSLYESGHRGIAYGAPATEDAARWAGWGTALKPGWEPIVVARKPLAGTVAGNVLAHGTGALNVDGCRVGNDTSRGDRYNGQPPGGSHGDGLTGGPRTEPWTVPAGRWPPNVLLGPEAAEELDRQSGTLTSGANPARRGSDGARGSYGEFAGQAECVAPRGVDAGGASRFFPAFHYQAKATTSERPRLPDGTSHPTVKPLPLVRWLVRLVTPPTVHETVCSDCGQDMHGVQADVRATSERPDRVQHGVPPEARRPGPQEASDAVSNVRKDPRRGPREEVLQHSMPSAGAAETKDVQHLRPAIPGASPNTADVLADMCGAGREASSPSVRDVWPEVPASVEQDSFLFEGLPQQGAGVGQAEGFAEDSQGLHPALRARASDGNEAGLPARASQSDGGCARPDSLAVRGSAPQERHQARQSPREPGSSGEAGSRPDSEATAEAHSVPPLPGNDQSLGACARCGGPLVRVERRGLVLDPFAGSGTTAEACIVEGFRCVLVEKDPAYAELIKARLRKPIQPGLFGMDAAS